jgi:hypothetical protein
VTSFVNFFLLVILNFVEGTSFEDINTEKEFQVIDSFLALYQNEKFKDFTIFYDGKSVTAHKCILSASSHYFDRMLCGKWSETNSCSLELLENTTLEDFQTFIKYLYLQRQNLLSDRGWKIFELCDYFDVLPTIKSKVTTYLFEHVHIDNARRFIPLVNRNINMANGDPNGNENHSSSIYNKFLDFLIGKSKELAEADFPFHELEPQLLKDMFLGRSRGLKEGWKVEVNYRAKGRWFPGIISHDRGDGFYDICYDNGDQEKNVEKSLVRSPKSGDTKKKLKSATTQRSFTVGARVDANYKSRGRYFPGRIQRVCGNRKYDIEYDDGDVELNMDEKDIRLLSNN